MDGASGQQGSRFEYGKYFSRFIIMPLDAFWKCSWKLGLLNRKQNDGKAVAELILT
jgi:hypothetical protein